MLVQIETFFEKTLAESVVIFRILYPKLRSLDSAVGRRLATGWTTEVRSSRAGRVKNFLFSTSSRQPLGHTQPRVQLVSGVFSPGGKAAGM
jgi:hypothetical protein